jgi:hypothetical protein
VTEAIGFTSMYIKHSKPRDKSFSQVAKKYSPAKRADKPHIISSILSLASENMSSCASGTEACHEFAEIFHPYLYPDYVVYQYINKDRRGTRQIECAFDKSEFTVGEWDMISKAVRNRRAFFNGVVKTSSVIELSHGSLH